MNTKVVLITGALTGIGHATALAFAKEGARLIVSGRRDEAGAELVKELREAGAEAEYVRADVRIEGDVQNLVDQPLNVSDALMSLSTMREQKENRVLSSIKPWKVIRRLRYQCPWHLFGAQARAQSHDPARVWQYHKYLLDAGSEDSARSVHLCRDQTCRGRADQDSGP